MTTEKKRMIWGLIVLTGCAVGGPSRSSDDGELTERPRTAEPIIGGSEAYDYPEAVMLNFPGGGLCSGSLIAPKLVLTAGHCVTQFTKAEVIAPYANPSQSAMGFKSAVFDYTDTSNYVNPNQHDVGVIFLSSPITLAHYLKLDKNAVSLGATKAHNIGRIDNGKASYTDLFRGPTVTLLDGQTEGFPFAYTSNDITQPGDSGGPVVIHSAPPRTVVGVCSGGGNGGQLMARLDLVHDWLESQIAIAGGGGSSTSASTSGAGGGSSTGSSGVGGAGGSGSTVAAASGVGGSTSVSVSGTGGGTPSPCHNVCDEGPPMVPSCSPCIAATCAFDPYCCQVAWDGQCVGIGNIICGGCSP